MIPNLVTLRMFLSGVQIRIRLDSRLKHAGMTELGMGISATQQAAGNRPAEIEQAEPARGGANHCPGAASNRRWRRHRRRALRRLDAESNLVKNSNQPLTRQQVL